MIARTLSLLLALALAAASPALADKGRGRGGDDDDGRRHERHEDHERRDAISRAVEKGEALPLADVLAIVRNQHPGEIVGVEVENEHGAWHYEVRVAGDSGRLLEVYVDARTGQILKVEDK